MSDTNNTLKKKENQYHHLTEQDRNLLDMTYKQETAEAGKKENPEGQR